MLEISPLENMASENKKLTGFVDFSNIHFKAGKKM